MNDVLSSIDSGSWMLDPHVTYLNHASFGARRVEIYEAQQRYKRVFERSPVDFLDRNRHLVDQARRVIANFVGADHQGFGFVENATTGIGCVVHSIPFDAGDEILTTDHVYNGVRQLLHQHAQKNSLLYRELEVPLPVHCASDITTCITNAISDKTKLLVVDHVASASSILFPVQEIVDLCREKGILLLIDGAHAPGMIDLHIEQLAPDWYVANLHKWVCAPLGAAFVWTNKKHRSMTHPMTISHWLGEGYTNEFDWQGTRDVSAWLAAADAVKLGHTIGWERIRHHNHGLVTWMHSTLVDQLGVEPLSPINGSMLGSMVTVLLPPTCPQERDDCIAMRDTLYEKFALEVPIFEFQGRGMLRVSAQLYSKKNDMNLLLNALNCIKSS